VYLGAKRRYINTLPFLSFESTEKVDATDADAGRDGRPKMREWINRHQTAGLENERQTSYGELKV